MIKSHFCFSKEDVVRYINDNKIKKDDIVEIVWLDSKKGFVVFHWTTEEVLKG